MLHALDHAVVVVEDLEAATASYRELLGRRPSWRGEHPRLATANTLFRLANTYLELLSPVSDGGFADQLRARLAERGEGLLALAFATDDAAACSRTLRERGVEASDPVAGEGRDEARGAERRWRNVILPAERTRGVMIFCIEQLSPPEALPPAEVVKDEASSVEALDHVVVRSRDAGATRALYGETLGLRLALDKEFPQYGSHLLFFRVGGVTVEIGAPLDPDPQPDTTDELWGLAWRTPDVDAAQKRLAAAGFDVSRVRSGRKPGTRVCTVKAPTQGVATLVIGPG